MSAGAYSLRLKVWFGHLVFLLGPLLVSGKGLVGVFGNFFWDERAVAFERVVDEITPKATAR